MEKDENSIEKDGNNITSFCGSSCANNGKGALSTPENKMEIYSAPLPCAKGPRFCRTPSWSSPRRSPSWPRQSSQSAPSLQ
eukprot:1190136-Prorocentrum_minimum.AAC.3